MGVQSTPVPAVVQLGVSPVLDRTQSFSKGKKFNLTSNSRYKKDLSC